MPNSGIFNIREKVRGLYYRIDPLSKESVPTGQYYLSPGTIFVAGDNFLSPGTIFCRRGQNFVAIFRDCSRQIVAGDNFLSPGTKFCRRGQFFVAGDNFCRRGQFLSPGLGTILLIDNSPALSNQKTSSEF